MSSVRSLDTHEVTPASVATQAAPLLERADLVERLSAASADAVILLAAPAGSGKTVLLHRWLESTGIGRNAAWVSVERGERDPTGFWSAVINGLRATAAGSSITVLQPSPDFDGRVAVDRLIAQLGSLEEPLVLVIDDLHELASADALEQLERLIAQRARSLRIVLSTRHDPQLGLHRLRLAGQLLELRAADLRFDMDEAAALLSGAGVQLSAQSIARLHARTEGWAAGLRLAALSLARQQDPDAFVAEFSGSERTVAGYLLSEVLDQQPEEVRDLLLRTSLVERVNGSLADMLTDRPGSEGILLDLERNNAFVTSVDGNRSWFRYHQLFADLLQLELRRVHGELVPELHRRASIWFAGHGRVLDAIRHAQAAEDWQRAVELLADNTSSLMLDGQIASTMRLVEAFPSHMRANAELACVLAALGVTKESLDDARMYLGMAAAGGDTVAPARRPAFELALSTVQLAIDARLGDYDSVNSRVQRLLDKVPETETEPELTRDARAMALMNLGVVEYWSYQPQNAVRHLTQALDLARSIPRPRIEIVCLAHLALEQSTHSITRQRELAAAAVAVADAHGWGSDPVSAMPLAAMAGADVIQGRFAGARPWLLRAQEALRPGIEPATELLVRFLAGMLALGEGRTSAAVEGLRAAAAVQRLLVTPHVVTTLADQCLIHTQLRQGDVEGAKQTLEGLPDDERDSGEIRIAAADVRLHEGDPAGALELLKPVLENATRLLGTYTLIQADIVEALAHERLGNRSSAQSALERALDLAEPETLIFPFVVTHPQKLLDAHPRPDTRHAALLSELRDVLAGSPLAPVSSGAGELLEPITDSELRVLRYLPSNLSAPEIASELFVSTSTVKTHMRHIYGKLDVHGRNEAVQRARELGLLARSTR